MICARMAGIMPREISKLLNNIEAKISAKLNIGILSYEKKLNRRGLRIYWLTFS